MFFFCRANEKLHLRHCFSCFFSAENIASTSRADSSTPQLIDAVPNESATAQNQQVVTSSTAATVTSTVAASTAATTSSASITAAQPEVDEDGYCIQPKDTLWESHARKKGDERMKSTEIL